MGVGLIDAAATQTRLDLDDVNRRLADATAEGIVRWAHDVFGQGLVMSSSFGAQSAVMLHLVTRLVPDIPVVWVDTGYLFPETYRFAEQLRTRLGLNLKVYQAELSPARYEALHGREWEEDGEGLDRYHQARKVEPMQRALRELGARAWMAGLRRDQTDLRAGLRPVEVQGRYYKVYPILNWSGKDVHEYLKRHGLPHHPLYEQGYASIGDTHSTLPVGEGGLERAGRFGGLKQECGLHLPTSHEENESLGSSGL